MIDWCIDMTLIDVDKKDFDDKVINSDKPVIVDFWAEWCGPCKALAPVFEKVSEDYKDKLVFAKLDVEKGQDIAARYMVQGIPCMIFFNNGKEVDRIVGSLTESMLKKKIDNLLGLI